MAWLSAYELATMNLKPPVLSGSVGRDCPVIIHKDELLLMSCLAAVMFLFPCNLACSVSVLVLSVLGLWILIPCPLFLGGALFYKKATSAQDKCREL